MSGNTNVPWHSQRFIPEIRLRDGRHSVEAWKESTHYPKVLILNYLELKKSGSLKKLPSIKKQLGEDSIIILSCVGEDRFLDRLNIEEYCMTADLLDAKAIVSPDDYIYRIDKQYAVYQNHHFRRALERTEAIMEKVQDRFSMIGLVVWANKYHIRLYVNRLKKCGVEDFACACGDSLKRTSARESLADIKQFLDECKHGWRILLGIDSNQYLQKLRPDAFSASSWSFYAARGMIYRNGRRQLRSQRDPTGPQLALYNLEQNYKLGEAIGRT
jgi:hypothetical protein